MSLTLFLHSQNSGNINYQLGKNNQSIRLPENNIQASFGNSNEFIFQSKGLYNVKADAYVAIFSVSQVAKTAEEVNRLIDERIKAVESGLTSLSDASLYVDMITFVPVYEYEIEKKIFSKKTYNEVPVGFELKKNLHIEYKNPETLNQLMRLCSTVEIYELVKVDYISSKLEQVKKEMREKAKGQIREQMKFQEDLLGVAMDSLHKELAEGFRVMYPVESYKSYQAFSSPSLYLTKSAQVNVVDKQRVMYYQPVVDKEFDFVVNPILVEPVIQVMYELKLKARRAPKKQPKVIQVDKEVIEYIWLTPQGEVKSLKEGR